MVIGDLGYVVVVPDVWTRRTFLSAIPPNGWGGRRPRDSRIGVRPFLNGFYSWPELSSERR